MAILPRITCPQDLHGLSLDELNQVAAEIREELIDVISRVGGHFGPNLGVVELTVALHATFNSPRDKIIWDVGHQSYPHKMLTGRRDRLSTIRQYKGLVGYCARDESPHDFFGAGHGSTSIAAALGFAKARDLRGGGEKVIAVIGDGSLTGGLALEALNNAGHLKTNLLIVLNDNEMSISPNVGALSSYLARVRTDPHYLKYRDDFAHLINSLPLGRSIVGAVEHLKSSVKQMLLPGMLFEELGLTYLGPMDGHNIGALKRALDEANRLKGPVLLHVLTVKGKGYEPAENDSGRLHACTPFDRQTGKSLPAKPGPPTYSTIFAETLVALAAKDPRIVAVTAAMADGTGLSKSFAKMYPDRMFDVGMAEQYAVCFAGGLAAAGMRPCAAIYSTFLQRAFDQVIHDVCIQNLPVVFCLDRAGIVGDDGPTHQGCFDIAYLRHVPNITVMAPKDEAELQRMMATAFQHDGPIAMRYPRGAGVGADLHKDPQPLPIGIGERLREGSDVALLAYGSMVHPALEAAQLLEQQGIHAAVANARFAKPLDRELILSLAAETRRLVTLEEGTLLGGFGSGVLELLNQTGLLRDVEVLRLGYPDQFIEHGDRKLLLANLSLDPAGIAGSVAAFCGARKQASAG